MSPRAQPKAPQPAPARRSDCPVASSLDLLGDKWTLLVLRDLFIFDIRRFGEFVEAAEGIPTNLLAARLKRLEEAGLVERRPYRAQPLRHEYSLSAKGRDLLPVIRALREWGLKHLPGTRLTRAAAEKMAGKR